MVVLLSLQIFVLMAVYYLLRTSRDVRVLADSSAEIKSYASAAQALLMLLLLPAYGVLAARFSPLRLARGLTLLWIGFLGAFFLADRAGLAIGVPFYLWVGIFGITAIAQFWAFATDVYTEEQGTRLFPVLGVGSSVGGFAGAQLARITLPMLGSDSALLLAAGLMTVSVVILSAAHRYARRGSEIRRSILRPVRGGHDALEIVLSSRYLTLIAAMVVLLNLVSATGEFVLGKMAVDHANQVASSAEGRRMVLASFYGDYYAWITLGAMVVQVFLVSRILKWTGVGGALMILPLIAMGGYAAAAAAPALAILRMTKVLEGGAEYSIANTARHALLLPANRETKYKAKAAIEAVFTRVGDLFQAGIIAVGSRMALTVSEFTWINAALAALWLLVAAALSREYRAESSRLERAAGVCALQKMRRAPTTIARALALPASVRILL